MKNKFLIMLISIMLVSLIAASILGYIENNKRSNNVVDNSNTIDDETTDEEKVNENGDKVLSFYSRSDLNTLVVGKCNNTSKCTYITDYTCKNKNCRVLALSKNYALINDGSIVLSNVRYNDNNDIQNLSLNNYKIQLIENNDQIYGMIVDDNNKKAFYSFADRMYTIPFGDYQIYPVEPQNAEWRLDGLILIDYNSDSYEIIDYNGKDLYYGSNDLTTKLTLLEGTNLRYFTTHLSNNTEKFIIKPDGRMIDFNGIIDTETVKVENERLIIRNGNTVVAQYDKNGNKI